MERNEIPYTGQVGYRLRWIAHLFLLQLWKRAAFRIHVELIPKIPGEASKDNTGYICISPISIRRLPTDIMFSSKRILPHLVPQFSNHPRRSYVQYPRQLASNSSAQLVPASEYTPIAELDSCYRAYGPWTAQVNILSKCCYYRSSPQMGIMPRAVE